MITGSDYIQKYIEKTGLVREKISSPQVPEPKKIKVFAIFGELASLALFSKTVYPQLVADEKYYNIVLTWNGLRCFFDKADEVWGLNQSHNNLEFYKESVGIANDSKNINVITRSLHEYFLNVVNPNDYKDFFSSYLKENFYTTFKTANLYFPEYLTNNYLSKMFIEKIQLSRDKNIAIMPMKYFIHWQDGKQHIVNHYQDLYQDLIMSMLEKKYNVFCIQNDFTFDISRNLQNDNLHYFKENDFQKIITMIHRIGNYFDYFGNSTFVGMLAQADCFNVVERNTWINSRKMQEHSIFASNKICKNYFSFLNLVRTDVDLNQSYFKGIIRSLDEFCKKNESNTFNIMRQKQVNFDDVIKLTAKKFHGKLVKVLKGSKNA
jgi:hypothetical protein